MMSRFFRENGVNGSGRSGIFVTACELLRALVRDDRLDISLYAKPAVMPLAREFLRLQPEFRDLLICNEFECRGIRAVVSVLERREFRLHDSKYGMLRPLMWEVYQPVRRLVLWMMRIFTPAQERFNRRMLTAIARRHDAFLSPMELAPVVIRESGIPCFYIFHDAIPVLFPQFYPQEIVGMTWTETVMRNLRASDRGFANSENTKRDYLRLVPGLREENVAVIGLAASERFHPEPRESARRQMRTRYGIPPDRPYFLSLSTIKPRKNLPFALKAFARRHQSHPELLFVLPPLEAMQCGCPVLSSNTSSLPEVAGGAALAVAPDDFAGMLSAMERMLTDAGLRDRLRRCGLERCRLFRWAKSAAVIADRIRMCTEAKADECSEPQA